MADVSKWSTCCCCCDEVEAAAPPSPPLLTIPLLAHQLLALFSLTTLAARSPSHLFPSTTKGKEGGAAEPEVECIEGGDAWIRNSSLHASSASKDREEVTS